MNKFLIIFILISVLVIITIVCVVIYLRRKNKILGGNEQMILYHGSKNKYNELKPTYSNYAGLALFGASSYDDAVIFAAGLSDYDVVIWGSDHRYIQEQYPGAFNGFKHIYYIHHLIGNFKPLGKGLQTEYITDESIKPFQVDRINCYDYLKHSKNVIMQTYKQFLDYRNKVKRVKLPDVKVLLHIGMADPNRFDLNIPGIKIVQIFELDMNNTTDKFIIIGDLLLGNEFFEFNTEHVYYQQDINELISSYKGKCANYPKYLEYSAKLYKGIKNITREELKNLR